MDPIAQKGHARTHPSFGKTKAEVFSDILAWHRPHVHCFGKEMFDSCNANYIFYVAFVSDQS